MDALLFHKAGHLVEFKCHQYLLLHLLILRSVERRTLYLLWFSFNVSLLLC